MRIGNGLVIGFAALTGYVFTGGELNITAVYLFISALFIGVYGNIINDIYDIEIDKINKPWRPLPSGRISLKEAWLLGTIFCVMGLIISFLFLSVECFLIASIAALLLILYSKYLKRTGLPGNLTISFLSLLVIIYGGIMGDDFLLSLIPGLYAFIIILGREIFKGLEDIEGDRKYNVKTVAVILGEKYAVIIGSLTLLIVVVISPLPYVFLGLNIIYLIIAFLGVDLPIIYSIMLLRKNPIGLSWKVTRLLKIPLFAGLLAFFAGVII